MKRLTTRIGSPLAQTLALTLLALALANCASVPSHVDTGPIKAATFSFINMGPKTTPDYAQANEQAHAIIQKAITQNLAAKGVRHVPERGDVVVAYLIILGNNATTTSINDYFGYSDDAIALLDKIHSEETIKSDRRDFFEEGTLVIDIMQASSSKLVSRSSVQREVLRNITPDARASRIQEAVDAALQGVKIAR